MDRHHDNKKEGRLKQEGGKTIQSYRKTGVDRACLGSLADPRGGKLVQEVCKRRKKEETSVARFWRKIMAECGVTGGRTVKKTRNLSVWSARRFPDRRSGEGKLRGYARRHNQHTQRGGTSSGC